MLIKPVSLPEDLHLLADHVTCVRRSAVHLLTARHNAWHSTTTNLYRTNAATFTTASSARRAAERQRKAGTYFVIVEIPSLVFDLGERSLVVTQLNVSPLFKSWNAPQALTLRNIAMTGVDVVNVFSSRNYRESTSGWQVSQGQPDVILGISEGTELTTSHGRGMLHLERSSAESGGWMSFSVVRTRRANPTHLERIIGELNHLTHQRLRVHEVASRFRITSADVLNLLEMAGSPAKGPRSWVEVASIDQIRALARKQETT
ncbi:hypothetical protein QFZ35_003894 [Arthrobacter ulcerisalmonis]|nr:hypothetical protein [Arthrobacter ulcerisalmonis]